MNAIVNIGRLMILDDQKDLPELFHPIMKEKNLEVEITQCPDLFMSKIESSHLNVVALDHFLPGNRTGIEYLQEIRKINRWSWVIAMSGQPNKFIVEEYINNGVNRYIDKNWKDSQIAQVLKRYKVEKECPDYLDVLAVFFKEALDEAKERAIFFSDMIKRQIENREMIGKLKSEK